MHLHFGSCDSTGGDTATLHLRRTTMASSIMSQLQAIKSLVQADTEPIKRPFTRPSILFSPKAAADIDIETIYNLGLGGFMYTIQRIWYYVLCHTMTHMHLCGLFSCSRLGESLVHFFL
ncbi:PREDICTED: uncharacterized protein LOC104803129 [Tarenaya hassleriana]|uniref:uncharacterized protein LOC104803129 n=1 Tax=Tarenaya hassleriana TaxID=28532 RepID=UPI00053C867B|nr:PREDICTED: uncharacterized protein LOC104803129 [Tarenaya hassleriana]